MAVFTLGESGDDCQIDITGEAVTIADTSNYVGRVLTDGPDGGAGLRFRNLTIPPGSTILTAVITFKASVQRTNTVVNTIFKGDQDTTPPVYSNWADYAARTPTIETVDWLNVPAWQSDTEYESPDLTDIIQEIIDLGGWASGNALAIFWLENGSDHANFHIRNFYAWDWDVHGDGAFITITWDPPEAVGGGGGPAGLLIAQGVI